MGFIIGVFIFAALAGALMLLMLILAIRKLVWAIREEKMSMPYRRQRWKEYKARKRRRRGY